MRDQVLSGVDQLIEFQDGMDIQTKHVVDGEREGDNEHANRDTREMCN